MLFKTVLVLGAGVFFLAGCGSGGSGGSGGSTSTSNAPVITLSSSSLAFPSTQVGQQSPVQTVIVSNTGNATATLNGYTLTGNTTDFTLVSNTCGTALTAGTSCNFNFVFQPVAAGAFTLTISINDNATNSPQTLTFTGTGITNQVTLTPGTVSFPSTLAGTTSAAQVLTLTNGGSTSLAVSGITLGGTSPGDFAQTNTCGTSVAASGTCTINVTFTPAAASSYTATLSVTDGATSSPQTATLAGTGTASAVLLSTTALNFPTTQVSKTSSPMSATLTNTGNATLTISGITLGGTNSGDFAETTTCGATLAAGANCTISATFTPAAASSYAATITITDSATGSPQVISLSGAGSTTGTTHTLYVFPETDNSVTPLYALINGAQKTIDMTMYALEDTTFSADLVAACQRGVTVRVILDVNDEKSGNTPAYTQLNAQKNCSAVWANTAFEATHEKSFIIDGSTVSIMSLNLQSQYYSTTRDFALVENDLNDIAAIQATFNSDYAAGTPSGGTQGTSDFSYQPLPGDDLIWSPTTAQADMLAIISNAKSTLLVENEEMGAANIVSALETACKNGVVVHIAMVSQSSYASNFTALEAAGCGVHVYPNTTNGFYIHAKAVVADYGLSTQSVYMGSINYSSASMNNNRELGMYLSDSASVSLLYTTMAADYAGGTTY